MDGISLPSKGESPFNQTRIEENDEENSDGQIIFVIDEKTKEITSLYSESNK